MFFNRKEKLNLTTLRPVFDAQKKVLVDQGYPEFELEQLWNQLAKKADGIEIAVKGTIPLLIVVNQGDVKEKIAKINGHTELNLNNIVNNQNQSNSFSLLLDVEDGEKMVAKSPETALKKFAKEKRFPLDINESIALLAYKPEILKNHYVISAGSFYTTPDNESLPLLWLLSEHSNPELHYAWFHIAHGSYGAPSYAIKI